MRKNLEVAHILYEIADLLELQGVQWKPQAYRKAAQSIESLSEDVAVYAKEKKLQDIPGVGVAIAEKIEEIVKTGRLKYLSTLRKEIPIRVEELAKVEGLGPKTMALLYKKLNIKNVKNLENAAKKGKLQKLEGLGAKKEGQILESITRLKKRGPERVLLGEATPFAEEIIALLKKVPGTEKVEAAGSYRRGKETVGDIDILVISHRPKQVMDAFVHMKGIAKVFAKGETKSSILLHDGLQVDVRVVGKEHYGSALQYFTGSKEHSVELRKIALKKGYSLSEYGLSTLKGKKVVASRTEEDIYKKLGMAFIPPEMREGLGEIALAQKKKIPSLLSWKDVHGDFQTQTKWSDGNHSIEEMARAAEKLGWKFLTITDHVGGIGIAHPLDEKRLQKQAKEIDRLNKKLNIHIFKGAEIDIMKDGKLALSLKACRELDVVLASLHSAFRQSPKDMTRRICAAFENYPVHIFGHPSARLINQRDAVQFDLEKVFQKAKDTEVFLELNGQPSRMDLKDSHAFKAREMGCSFVLSSDAHSTEQLSYVQYAVLSARRAWLEKKHVLNVKSVKEIEKILAKKS